MRLERVEACVERICQKGCQAVHGDIALMQKGTAIAEVKHLSDWERRLVLQDLRSVMAVYDRCAPASLASSTG